MPSLAVDVGASTWLAGAGAVYAPGFVPPFRAGARDRLAFGVGGRWMPDARVQVAVGFEGLHDASAGTTATGPGDVRLGATALLVQPGPFRAWLGWSAKLPDARDEDDLGTDETDVTFGGTGELHGGPWRALVGVGLGVWGNPLRFANQDDVPELRASASWTATWLQIGVTGNADLATTRNPARVVLGGWARHDFALGSTGRFLFVELGGGAGLTPAAPDGVAAIAFGAGGHSRGP